MNTQLKLFLENVYTLKIEKLNIKNNCEDYLILKFNRFFAKMKSFKRNEKNIIYSMYCDDFANDEENVRENMLNIFTDELQKNIDKIVEEYKDKEYFWNIETGKYELLNGMSIKKDGKLFIVDEYKKNKSFISLSFEQAEKIMFLNKLYEKLNLLTFKELEGYIKE